MTGEHDTFTRMLSLAVHELRTPVTVVNGYLRMVLKGQGGPLSEKQRKMLEEAERSCERIGQLVSQMSEVGKLDAGELALARQDVDMAALLAEVAKDMHEGADRGVTVDLRAVDRPLVIVGDRARLSAALRALLHATLRERVEPGSVIAECSIVANPVPSVVIAIGDADIVQTILRTVPDDSQAFDEWRGGVGLTLPLARRVIAAHGGSLWSARGVRPCDGSAVRLPLKSASDSGLQASGA